MIDLAEEQRIYIEKAIQADTKTELTTLTDAHIYLLVVKDAGYTSLISIVNFGSFYDIRQLCGINNVESFYTIENGVLYITHTNTRTISYRLIKL